MITFEINDFEQWRQAARELLIQKIPPDQVCWQNQQQSSLFDDDCTQTRASAATSASPTTVAVTVPKLLFAQIKQAACFIDPKNPVQKWAIFYSLLWRTVYVHRATLSLKTDSEVQALTKMVKAVNRDQHKMKAFVRFKRVGAQQTSGTAEEYFTAWFEPEHAIVESLAPFFVKRFTGMSWSILTPHGCAHWNQTDLKLSDGVARPKIAADEFELFWQTYYCNIFNPARLKESAMRSEMPKKYWKYLPEAQCIKDLSRDAAARSGVMLNQQLTEKDRIRKKSQTVTAVQNRLRQANRI